MNSFFKWPGQCSKQTLLKEREPTETQTKGKLELPEVLRSYAGGTANWAPHRAERGPYTGRGASTVGLFAVTGPAEGKRSTGYATERLAEHSMAPGTFFSLQIHFVTRTPAAAGGDEQALVCEIL